MRVTVEQAHEARKALFQRFGPVMESCSLVLTDRGFVLVVKPKVGVSSKLRADRLPAEMNGVPVRYK
jgi:hypothetical protein